MKPLIFTQGGKRIATLTPQEGKTGEVFTLGSAAKCDIVLSAEYGLAPQPQRRRSLELRNGLFLGIQQ